MALTSRIAPGTHERRVARRLEGRGFPGLAESLVALHGTTVGERWRVRMLYAVGAEGAVYLADDVRDDAGPRCVIKIPLVPYHRPAELSSLLLRHRRAALRTEAESLSQSGSPWMPQCYGLHPFTNPMLDRKRGGAFAEPDVALVMERLGGLDVDLWLARIHRSGIDASFLRPHLDRISVDLLLALHDLEERGFIYADLRPGNLRVGGRPMRRVRLLDAGSLVRVGDDTGKFPHVPAYLPPDLFDRQYVDNTPIRPSSHAQAVMAGRTMYELATGRVPVPGLPLDLDTLREASVSRAISEAIDGLAGGNFPDVLHATRFLTRRAVRRPPTPARRAAPAVAAPAAAAVEQQLLPPTRARDAAAAFAPGPATRRDTDAAPSSPKATPVAAISPTTMSTAPTPPAPAAATTAAGATPDPAGARPAWAAPPESAALHARPALPVPWWTRVAAALRRWFPERRAGTRRRS